MQSRLLIPQPPESLRSSSSSSSRKRKRGENLDCTSHASLGTSDFTSAVKRKVEIIDDATKARDEAIMDAEYNLDNLFNFREWSSQNTSQQPDAGTNAPTGASPFSDQVTASTTASSTPFASGQQSVLPQSRLTFLQEEDWDPTSKYDQDSAYLQYSVEWILKYNRGKVSSDTEPRCRGGTPAFLEESPKGQT